MSDRAESEHGDTDFVWRFRLHEKPLDPKFEDSQLEWIRVQWEQLLNLCVPMSGDQDVKIDGFRLMRDLESTFPIFSDDPRWTDRNTGRSR